MKYNRPMFEVENFETKSAIMQTVSISQLRPSEVGDVTVTFEDWD